MIRISLLGRTEVSGPSGISAEFATRRGLELFAFLVLEAGRLFDRGRLAGQFWGHLPEDRARRALNTEVWRLVAALRAVGMDTESALPRSTAHIGYMAQPDHTTDVSTLDAAMAVVRATSPQTATAQEIARVNEGVAVYRGDLLETVWSDWCLLWRENLRARHSEALEFLLEAAMVRQDWATGLRHAKALLALDPLLEHVHRAVMRCHFHNGDRPLAMRQYALCEQILRKELGVAPMDETRRIQETILAVPGPRPAPGPVAGFAEAPRRRSDATRSPAQKVDLALANINTARIWLEEAGEDLRRPPQI